MMITYILRCTLIILIAIRLFKKFKAPAKKRVAESQLNDKQLEMRKDIKIMYSNGTYIYNGRFNKTFVNKCYALHFLTWGPIAVSRKNFGSRIKVRGYVKAINKMPIYKGNSKRGD